MNNPFPHIRKRSHTFLIFLFVFILISCSTSKNFAQDPVYETQQSGDITYQEFYDNLSPYGNWVDYPSYGYCWVPNIPGFRPYATNGHWVYSNFGWTWVSGYNWGWAPFHYGRWINDISFGWMWVPGYEWGPAWVSWCGGGDYYGWAPLGPGMSINISIGAMPVNYWNFVPRRYINSPRINNYYVNPSKNVTIIHNTTIINNTNTQIINNKTVTRNNAIYNAGPSASDVERGTNMKIRQVKLVEKSSPGTAEVNNRSVAIYRPVVRETSATNARPPRVLNAQEMQGERRNNSANPESATRQPERRFNTPQNPVGNNRRLTPAETPVQNAPQQPQRRFDNSQNAPQNPVGNNRRVTPAETPVQNAPQQPQRRFDNSQNAPQNPVGNNRRVTPAETPVQNAPQQPQRRFDNSQNNSSSQTENNRRFTPAEVPVQNVPQQPERRFSNPGNGENMRNLSPTSAPQRNLQNNRPRIQQEGIEKVNNASGRAEQRQSRSVDEKR